MLSMKKSQKIVLSAVMLAAISSCNDHHDEWTYGKDQNGHTHDTSIYRNGSYHYYRYYGGGWFLLGRNNMINTGAYLPASSSEISSPSFSPRSASGGIRGGGFGSSGEGAGE
jgi:hypothetical protein